MLFGVDDRTLILCARALASEAPQGAACHARMTIQYKFKSSNAQHSVQFDGPHIPLAELRAKIVADNHIVKGRDFFVLELSNAQTGEVYGENSLVGRNTAVLVKRVPLTRQEPIQARQRARPKLMCPSCASQQPRRRGHAPSPFPTV